MTAKVDQLEAEADAAGELASISADQKLEDKFKELESSGDTADKLLEDLKAKMGKLEDKK
jgi:phage shock protein A